MIGTLVLIVLLLLLLLVLAGLLLATLAKLSQNSFEKLSIVVAALIGLTIVVLVKGV